MNTHDILIGVVGLIYYADRLEKKCKQLEETIEVLKGNWGPKKSPYETIKDAFGEETAKEAVRFYREHMRGTE